MKSKEQGRTRFMMQREQTSEIDSDHHAIYNKPAYDVHHCAACKHSWGFSEYDLSVEAAQGETFALAFGTSELANAFRVAFEIAMTSNAIALA